MLGACGGLWQDLHCERLVVHKKQVNESRTVVEAAESGIAQSLDRRHVCSLKIHRPTAKKLAELAILKPCAALLPHPSSFHQHLFTSFDNPTSLHRQYLTRPCHLTATYGENDTGAPLLRQLVTVPFLCLLAWQTHSVCLHLRGSSFCGDTWIAEPVSLAGRRVCGVGRWSFCGLSYNARITGSCIPGLSASS